MNQLSSKSYYAGMTVNERLWVSGLFFEFESAVSTRDISRAIEILKAVGISDRNNIVAILTSLGIADSDAVDQTGDSS